MITTEMKEKLKQEIFMCGKDAVDEFIGHELYDDKDVIDRVMDDIIEQMSDNEFMETYKEYVTDTNCNEKFYFTFGNSEIQPYKNGWVIVEAPNEEIARGIFALIYPNKKDRSTLRCAFVYSEQEWKETSMYAYNDNLGAGCHAVFSLMSIIN